MLMLSRFIGQSVMIGNEIRVNVIGVKPGKNADGEDSFLVRLGFEAPDEVEIYRSEIYQQRQKDSDSS